MKKKFCDKINIQSRFSILRFSAVFLVISLLLNVICTATGEEYSFLSVGGDESGAMIFDGIADFTPQNQSGEYWKYQYSLDYENPVWNELDVYSGDGYWYSSEVNRGLGLSQGARIRISNKNDALSSIGKASVCWAFYVPETGTITLGSNTASNYGTVEGYYGMVRITKNGTEILPECGWQALDGTAVSFKDTLIEVVEGDVIRFEVTSNKYVENGDGFHVLWNPNLWLMPEKARYTENSGILDGLTTFMYDFFSEYSSAEMDSASVNTLASAQKKVKESKYGVYSALDSIYSDGVIPTDSFSVWKYAVLKEDYAPFDGKFNESLNVKAENSEKGFIVSWDDVLSMGVYSITVSKEDNSIQYYTTEDNSIILPKLSENDKLILRVNALDCSSKLMKFYLKDGALNSEIVNAEEILYLDEQRLENKGKISEKYVVFDSNCKSEYKIFSSTANAKSAADAENGRRIVFSSASGEGMMFGFTAPFDGEYELDIPLYSNTTSMQYTVFKEDKNGIKTMLKFGNSDNNGCATCITVVELLQNETIWLQVRTENAADINIGVPQVALINRLTAGNETLYKYRAVDYFESTFANDKKYNNYSTTDTAFKVWSFGYFENPIDNSSDKINYDTLGIGNYIEGDVASALCNALKPYELIRSGVIYNSLLVSETSNGEIRTGEGGVVGIMYPALGFKHEDRIKKGLPYKSKGIFATIGYGKNTDPIVENKKSYNIGVYMQYTAPLSGNALLKLNDTSEAATAGDRMLVLKNGIVEAIYENRIASGAELDLGYLNDGDTVTLCYSDIDGGMIFKYIGSPIMELSDNWKSIFFDKTSSGSANLTSAVSAEIELPVAEERIGYKFIGWRGNVSGNLYNGRAIVGENTAYTAKYILYGDIDASGNIDAFDLSLFVKCILENYDVENDNADVNVDGNVNILDLVRIKKWMAGIPAVLGK